MSLFLSFGIDYTHAIHRKYNNMRFARNAIHLLYRRSTEIARDTKEGIHPILAIQSSYTPCSISVFSSAKYSSVCTRGIRQPTRNDETRALMRHS